MCARLQPEVTRYTEEQCTVVIEGYIQFGKMAEIELLRMKKGDRMNME